MSFDYTALPQGTADALRQSVAAIKSIQRGAVSDVGGHLTAAREILEHGMFSAWVEAEFRMTVRSAERYMLAANFLAGKPDTVSLLPLSVIFALSAPTAPLSVVDEVVIAAERGMIPGGK